MNKELGSIKANQFMQDLKSGKIEVDKRPNHGEEFYGAYENFTQRYFMII